MSFWEWLIGDRGKKKVATNNSNGLKIIGDWRSNIIESHSDRKTHYRINNLNGLIEVLDGIERWGGKGVAEIKWWEPGMHLKLSATVDVSVLNQLKNEALDVTDKRET